jgi:type II secretory ATPase GspE/PulE/Tfp pilus assembly ATPase PilB-like protein
VALHELLVCDDELRHHVAHRRPVEELRAEAVRGGMTTLLQDGVEKALQGRTDLSQVLAVASR